MTIKSVIAYKVRWRR